MIPPDKDTPMMPLDDACGEDAFSDATFCERCGRENCEEHVPPAPPGDAPTEEERQARIAEQRARKLADLVDTERLRREVKRIVDTELRPPFTMPAGIRLRDRLATPRTTPDWRIRQWQPAGSRILLSAQFKSGKTILRDNWVRSLVDGDPFLGRDDVLPVAGSVVIVDVEMPEAKAEQWLARQCIRDDDRVVLYSLRNAEASFNLLDDTIRQQWVEACRAVQAEAIVLDCVRPVLDAIGLDEQREAGQFLIAFDQLLREAGITDALVIHHMGHTNERARGDSRLRDWPDVEWRLMRKDESPSSARFITAYGRDVDVEESALTFDSLSHKLTIGNGSRAQARKRDALDAIVDLLAGQEPLNGTQIKDALVNNPHTRNSIEAALLKGVQEHALVFAKGKNNANLYSRRPSVS